MNIALIIEAWPSLLKGALLSLTIATCSFALGIVLGALFVYIQRSEYKIIRFLIGVMLAIIKGTPMLIQIFMAFYILPQFGIMLPAFWTAVIAIGINSGAYICAIFGSALDALGMGQYEAAQVLGFSKLQAIWYIIIPQVFKIILPTMGNELITLVKDSSLASTIGVLELLKRGAIIRCKYFDSVTVFLMVALLYLFLTGVITIIVWVLERKISK